MFIFLSQLTSFLDFATVQLAVRRASVSGVIHGPQGVALRRFINQLSYWLKEKSVPSIVKLIIASQKPSPSLSSLSHQTYSSPQSEIRPVVPQFPPLSFFITTSLSCFLLKNTFLIILLLVNSPSVSASLLWFVLSVLAHCMLHKISFSPECRLNVWWVGVAGVAPPSPGLVALLPGWVSMVMMLCDRKLEREIMWPFWDKSWSLPSLFTVCFINPRVMLITEQIGIGVVMSRFVWKIYTDLIRECWMLFYWLFLRTVAFI